MLPRSLRRYLFVFLSAAAGSALSVALFFWALDSEEERARNHFEMQSTDLATNLQREVDEAIFDTVALQSYFQASAEVDRDEFRAFASGLLGRHGVQALSYNPLASSDERAIYEITAWTTGLPSFRFTETNAAGSQITAERRDEYVIVWYIEPFDVNRTALGYDVASDPVRAAAVAQARDTGEPAASERVTLVQEKEEAYGVLIVAPLYASAEIPATVAARRALFQGVVVAVVRVPDLVSAALAASPAGLEVSAFDGANSPDGAAALLLTPGSPNADGPSAERVVDVAGRSWSLVVQDSDGRLLRGVLPQSSLVLLCGLLLTAALSAYFFVATRRVERTERAIRDQTADLAKANGILSVEIATRELAETALSAHEQRFRTLMEGSADVLVELRDGIVEYVTPNFDKTLGDSVDALRGHSLAEFIHPDDLPGLAKYFQPGWTGALEATFRAGPAGGPWGWREAKGVRLIAADGTPQAILVIRDIDAHRQAEDALKERDQRTRAMLEAIPDMMFRLNSDGVYLDFKAERTEDLYVAPERIIGSNIRDLLPDEVAQPALSLIQLALVQGGVQTFEYALPKNGEPRYYEARITRSGADEVMVICRDVTERRRAESALRESERRFRELADGAPFVIYMTDENFQTVFVNKAMLSFTGRTFDEQLAVPLGVNRHHEDAQRLREISGAAIARRERFTCEQRFRNAAGEYRWLITDAQPRMDHNGNYAGYIGYSIDITDRVNAERQAYEAADREAVLRERQRIAQELHDSVAQYFFAIGMACNAGTEAHPGDSAIAAHLTRIRALATAGGDEIRRAISTLAEAPGESIAETLRRLCEDEPDGQNVTFACGPDVPELSPDSAALLWGAAREALFNARKHGFGSRVDVTLTNEGDCVRLSVRDDGLGRADDIHKKLIQRTGYGLPSLVARFAGSGGRVLIADDPGGGIDVSFVLPLTGVRDAA